LFDVVRRALGSPALPDAVFIPAEPSAASAPGSEAAAGSGPASAPGSGAASADAPPAADRLTATELARGPWDPHAQHGGAPAALLVRAFERCPGGEHLLLARATYELLRPAPLGPLEVSSSVVRPGRRVQLLEASLRTEDGVEVVRARGLKVQRADAPPVASGGDAPPVGTGGDAPPVGTGGDAVPKEGPPANARPNDYPSDGVPMFATDAMEIRFVAGAFLEPGPATAWFRLRHPLVAGESPSPLQRLAAAADFGNGISAVLPWHRYVFINPDLTIYVEREPVGEWIRLESETRIGRDGIGLCESLICDQCGRVGRATQALLVTRRG